MEPPSHASLLPGAVPARTISPHVVRRADATCFEAFARRVKGDGTTLDCTAHTNG